MKAVEARYENGVLRPERPLGLQPGERVRLIVLRDADAARWDLERLATMGAAEDDALARAGLDRWADDLDREDGR